MIIKSFSFLFCIFLILLLEFLATSTLVNELMLEALANDLIPQEIVLDVNHFQLRLQGRAELLRP